MTLGLNCLSLTNPSCSFRENVNNNLQLVAEIRLSYLDCAFYFCPFITRVRTGHGKPGKSWNFIMAFSRTGKSWKKATSPGKFWKSVRLGQKISSVWKAVRRINIEILGL